MQKLLQVWVNLRTSNLCGLAPNSPPVRVDRILSAGTGGRYPVRPGMRQAPRIGANRKPQLSLVAGVELS